MTFFQKHFPRTTALLAACKEMQALKLRGRTALRSMGRPGEDLDLDVLTMRAGVHLLEVNAQLGPCFITPAAQLLRAPGDDGGGLDKPAGRLH